MSNFQRMIQGDIVWIDSHRVDAFFTYATRAGFEGKSTKIKYSSPIESKEKATDN